MCREPSRASSLFQSLCLSSPVHRGCFPNLHNRDGIHTVPVGLGRCSRVVAYLRVSVHLLPLPLDFWSRRVEGASTPSCISVTVTIPPPFLYPLFVQEAQRLALLFAGTKNTCRVFPK